VHFFFNYCDTFLQLDSDNAVEEDEAVENSTASTTVEKKSERKPSLLHPNSSKYFDLLV
jgi:hypothetical protein